MRPHEINAMSLRWSTQCNVAPMSSKRLAVTAITVPVELVQYIYSSCRPIILGSYPNISHCLHVMIRVWHLQVFPQTSGSTLPAFLEGGDRKVDLDILNVDVVEDGISYVFRVGLPLGELGLQVVLESSGVRNRVDVRLGVRVRVNAAMFKVSIKVSFRVGGPAYCNRPGCSCPVQPPGMKTDTMWAMHRALRQGRCNASTEGGLLEMSGNYT